MFKLSRNDSQNTTKLMIDTWQWNNNIKKSEMKWTTYIIYKTKGKLKQKLTENKWTN